MQRWVMSVMYEKALLGWLARGESFGWGGANTVEGGVLMFV